MDVVAYTMEYMGVHVSSKIISPIQFEEKYYKEYKTMYEDCFYEMRKALKLEPYKACDSLEQLLAKKDCIYLLVAGGKLIGSVAVYGNEIDDLIVAKSFQNQGHGKNLLLFGVALLQKKNMLPITLGVAEWNQKAITLYKNNGFVVSKIETVVV